MSDTKMTVVDPAIAPIEEGGSGEASTSIPLTKILAYKTQNALRGICSETFKSGQKEVRSPYQAFADGLRDLYGNFNFCKSFKIPFEGDVVAMLDEMRWQLSIPDSYQASILADQSTEEMLPSIAYTKQGLSGVWRKIHDLDLALYDSLCPIMDKGVVAQAINRSQNSNWPSAQPSEDAANLNLEDNQQALAFRDSLSVGLIREWFVATQILDPYNSDLLRRIEVFREKFSIHGYNFSGNAFRASQGLSQKSADSLLRVKVQYEELLSRLRGLLVSKIAEIYADIESDGVALYSNSSIFRIDDCYYVLPAMSELNQSSDPTDLSLASVLKIEGDVVLRNRLPVAIASSFCAFNN